MTFDAFKKDCRKAFKQYGVHCPSARETRQLDTINRPAKDRRRVKPGFSLGSAGAPSSP